MISRVHEILILVLLKLLQDGFTFHAEGLDFLFLYIEKEERVHLVVRGLKLGKALRIEQVLFFYSLILLVFFLLYSLVD